MWTRPRQPRWVVERLNDNDVPSGTLSGVLGGNVKIAAFSRLGGTADITLSQSSHDQINYFRDRIRITYRSGIPGAPDIPMGVYIFDSPKVQHGIASEYEASLLPKTAIVDQDLVTSTYSLSAGSAIIPAVVALIESTGETRIAVTDSDAVTTSAVAFEAGESKLTIINELLTSANYTSLWADGTGQFRVEPYVEPMDREVVYDFAAGEASIHKPEWGREQDILNVPNRVVVVSPGTDDEPPIIGIAENTDADDPFSIPSRGRVIGRTEEVSDMSSQSAATAHARRLLQGGMTPVATIDVEHAIVPLEPHDRVRFDSHGERYATVREMSFDLTFASQCQALWREL